MITFKYRKSFLKVRDQTIQLINDAWRSLILAQSAQIYFLKDDLN